MQPGKRPRILIADDHKFVAEAARNVLEPEFEVVGIVENGRELIEEAQRLLPDAVIVDIAMPLLNGLEAGQRIKSTIKKIKILYLSMNLDIDIAAESFRRGASGYLPKTATISELPTALRDVLKGHFYISPLITRDKVSFFINVKTSPSKSSDLTGRQREVLQLLAEGRTMKEVADDLKLKRCTVAYHKYRIMKTLGAKNNAELVQYAVRKHLLFSRY